MQGLLAGNRIFIAAAGLLIVGLVMTKKRTSWQPPEKAAPFLPHMEKAERLHHMPDGLLARVAYQESRYRDDIISGETRSHAGAVGLMQIVPKWHPTVNPLDPIASINYAAAYLAKLKQQFGTWDMALAAYNWGPGNLRSKGFQNAPRETRDYVAQITADVEALA